MYIIIFLSTLVLVQFALFIKKILQFPLKVAENTLKSGLSASMVQLHLLPGNGKNVSPSPFSTKLVMFCRLAGIPHSTHVADFQKNPKGKAPFIIHDGFMIADSQLIIRYLENTFDISEMTSFPARKMELASPFIPYSKLSKKDQATSDLVRVMCENDLYWAIISIRWLGKVGISQSEKNWERTVSEYFGKIPAFIRGLLVRMLRVKIAGDAQGQGLIRHSPEDQLYLVQRSLLALNTLLEETEDLVQHPHHPSPPHDNSETLSSSRSSSPNDLSLPSTSSSSSSSSSSLPPSGRFLLGSFPSEVDCIAFGLLDCLMERDTWPSPLSDYLFDQCPSLVRYVHLVREKVFPEIYSPLPVQVPVLPSSSTPTPSTPSSLSGPGSGSGSRRSSLPQGWDMECAVLNKQSRSEWRQPEE